MAANINIPKFNLRELASKIKQLGSAAFRNVGTQDQDIPTVQYVNQGRKNLIINGGFDIWQRGTSFAGVGVSDYSADRWRIGTPPASSDITRISGEVHEYALRFTSGGTGSINILHFIEGVHSLLNKTVTLRLRVKVTGTTSSCAIRLLDGTAGAGTFLSQPFTPTGSLQTITLTGSCDSHVDANQNWLVSFYINGADATTVVEVHEAQLEQGSIATPFEYRPIAEELALCQRYFWKSFSQNVAPAQNVGLVGAIDVACSSTGSGRATVSFPVPMRTIPTLTTFNPSATNSNFRNTKDSTDSSLNISWANSDRAITLIPTLSAGNANDYLFIHATADAEL